MEMDQHLFDECTTAYRAERMKEKQVFVCLFIYADFIKGKN